MDGLSQKELASLRQLFGLIGLWPRGRKKVSTPTEDGLKWLAGKLDEVFEDIYGEPRGFALLVFRFDDPGGVGDYVSNGRREDMIKALRSAADRLENNEDIPVTKGNG